MSAHDQVHAHHCVADIEQGGIDGAVGRGAGKWLYIHEQIIGAVSIALEDFRRAPPRQGFENIGVLCAFVIALIGIAAKFGQSLCIIEDFRLVHAP